MLANTASSSPPPGEEQASGQTKYKGVRWRKWGRWVSEIRLPNSRDRIWLGSYDTPEQAARAFDAASVCLRGPDGAADGLNFPGSPPAVSRRTSDVQEVYAAAVSHANKGAGGGTAATATRAAVSDANDVATPMESLAAPAPLQVSSAERVMDWTQIVANPPPLFSPTVMGGHTHLTPSTAGACYPGLWSFDSGGSCSRPS